MISGSSSGVWCVCIWQWVWYGRAGVCSAPDAGSAFSWGLECLGNAGPAGLSVLLGKLQGDASDTVEQRRRGGRTVVVVERGGDERAAAVVVVTVQYGQHSSSSEE